MLVEKLDRIVEQEEYTEARVLAEAQRFRIWQQELTRKRDAIHHCTRRAETELSVALDAAGQVYVFGGGERGQFAQVAVGDVDVKSFHPIGVEYIKELWRKRVAPTAEELEEERNPQTSLRDAENTNKAKSAVGQEFEEDLEELEEDIATAERNAGAEEREKKEEGIAWRQQQLAEKETRLVNKFANVNCATNTGMLWGKRTAIVSCAMSNIFALTDLGEIYAWGGQDNWWHEIEADSHWQSHFRGDTTERSQKLLMSSHIKEPVIASYEEPVDPDVEQIEMLKTICKYYVSRLHKSGLTWCSRSISH
jgi:hypothetical protein